MASLDKLEGDGIEGLLLLLLLVIVLAGFYFGGGKDVAASGIRKTWYAVDTGFSKLLSVFTTSDWFAHPIANLVGKVVPADSANAGSSLGGDDFSFDPSDVPYDDSQLPDLSQIFG